MTKERALGVLRLLERFFLEEQRKALYELTDADKDWVNSTHESLMGRDWYVDNPDADSQVRVWALYIDIMRAWASSPDED